jgi:formylglycine-generating enzyme required for sulfatase activity
LRRAFDTFINTHGQEEEDRLLIYFAGHGHTLKPKYGGDMGYIVPVDAPNPQRDEVGFRARALSMEEIETYARRIQSKHALFLFDSCFSGAIFSLSRSVPEFINYKTSQPVRQFITSGQADETVPDVSIFRQQLVAALQGEADKDSDGYVTGSELGEFLQEQVTNYSHNSQHPQYGKLRDPFLDKGDFVFMVTRTAPPGPSSPSMADLKAQVEAQRQQVQEEQQRLDEERRLQAEHQKLQVEQEHLRQERAQLQGGGALQGTQVAVGVSPQQPVAKTLRNSIGMELVLIQAGTFQMGSTDSGADDDEKPVHTVRISRPFYLGQYEVTQAQWEAVMGNNPSKFKGDPSHPVEQVSWDNVQEFIRRLNAKEGGARYRLPTEAEWEYAARAGSTTVYSFGDSASQLGQSAWYEDNADGATHPVGRLQPNAWGLYDMHGNVWEWVQDWYGPYASSTVTDPTGPQSGGPVCRGGSWGRPARPVGGRGNVRPKRLPFGFRLLREV